MSRKRNSKYADLFANRTMWAAWAKVASGTSAPGVDGVTPDRFAGRLDRHLAELQTHLAQGTYQAQPLKPMTVRRSGKLRQIGLPTVRDRVAQRCFLEAFERELNASHAESSFAYRRGRSWLDALARVEQLRDGGRRYVFRGDIADFFDRIDRPILRRSLAQALHDPRAVDLAMAWAAAPLLGTNGLTERRLGVPQGAPISPALANLYLTDFDREVLTRRDGVVRYADDLVVCCADTDSAEQARFDVEQSLRPLLLELNNAKSYVSHFDTGFSFLGWVFFKNDGFEESPHAAWTHPMTVARGRADGGLFGPAVTRPVHPQRPRRPGR